MVVALTSKVGMSNSQIKALNLYMILTSKEKYQDIASKMICNLMLYRIHKNKKSRLYNISKAHRFLDKIVDLTKEFRQAKKQVRFYTKSKFNQDDLINILNKMHKDLSKFRKNQEEIMKKNDKLALTLDQYAKKNHNIDLGIVQGKKNKYYDTNDGVSLVKSEK
jgi:hypothetical protein